MVVATLVLINTEKADRYCCGMATTRYYRRQLRAYYGEEKYNTPSSLPSKYITKIGFECFCSSTNGSWDSKCNSHKGTASLWIHIVNL